MPEPAPAPAWVDVLDRLPDFGRLVLVWGDHCHPDHPAPLAYRRRETPGRPFWFWCAAEWRGASGAHWWWDGPAKDTRPSLPPVFLGNEARAYDPGKVARGEF